jgi:dephospho-CoA kinase
VQNKYSTIVIGLIGGIASGKSTIARLFKEIGKGKVIDADKIGYQVLNTPYVRKRLAAYYGKKALTKSKQVNRCYLADVCFCNRKNITFLNNLVHPLICKEISRQVKNVRKGIIIVDAA